MGGSTSIFSKGDGIQVGRGLEGNILGHGTPERIEVCGFGSL